MIDWNLKTKNDIKVDLDSLQYNPDSFQPHLKFSVSVNIELFADYNAVSDEAKSIIAKALFAELINVSNK